MPILDTQLAMEHCTRSQPSFDLIRRWLDQCESSHKTCVVLAQPHYPTRLLQLSEGRVRLCHTTAWQERPAYLTLSHCGGGLKLYTLTKENFQLHCHSIPQDELCQTFQDAIHITLRLGYHLLWIDSLCIIQDDEEDWKSEASKMSHVYGGSTLNIAAASALNGTVGCFFDRSDNDFRCIQGLRIVPRGSQAYKAIPQDIYRSTIRNIPLERYTSPLPSVHGFIKRFS